MAAYHKDALPTGHGLAEYTIDKVLGHGGFGITYLARDVTLGAQVAIKEYLPHQIATRDGKTAVILPNPSRDAVRDYHWGLKNFVKEARALAHFKHPNIVRVLRFLEANGTAYMVMEYEQGQSLADYLKHNGPRLEEPTLLRVFIPILNGLHAVHEADMLHLDIKPENIYLRSDNSPMLIDFGSARQAMVGHGPGQRVVLTHGYAPVEQYPDKGQQGPWTDIYAIGASMYRCACGKRPDDSLERYQAMLKYQADPLTPASKVGRNRYRENVLACIDWAMQIHAKDRPQSARALQDALMGKVRSTYIGAKTTVSSITGPPAAARVPPRAAPAALRRSRINWGPIVTRVLLGLVGIAIVTGVVVMWPQLEPYLAEQLARRPIEIRASRAPSSKPAPTRERTAREEHKPERSTQQAAVTPSPAPAVRAPHDVGVPAVLAGTLTGHQDWVMSLAFSPSGNWLASGGNDKTIRIWERSSGKLIGVLRGHAYPINSVAYSPDGRWLASAGVDGTVRLWDGSTGTQRGALRGYGYSVFTVDFSPDGKRIAAGGKDRTVFVWEVESGKRLHALDGHSGDVFAVAFSSTGRILASAGADRHIRLWNAQSGDPIAELTQIKDEVLALAFSPDGKWLASGDAGHAIRLWNADDGTPARAFKEHTHAVLALAFSPDSRWLAAGLADHSVRIFDVDSGRLVETLTGHSDYVQAVAFSPDGKVLASASRDGSIRIWTPR